MAVVWTPKSFFELSSPLLVTTALCLTQHLHVALKDSYSTAMTFRVVHLLKLLILLKLKNYFKRRRIINENWKTNIKLIFLPGHEFKV